MKALFQIVITASLISLPASGLAADKEEVERLDRMLRAEADESLQGMILSGYILDEPEVTAYLQNIAASLFPDRASELTLHVVADKSPNAFALPNGHLMVTEGWLAFMRNEAQLVGTIGHEAGHYFENHAREKQLLLKTVGDSYRKVQRMRWWDILRERTMYGRELELESDRYRVNSLVQGDYSLDHAASVWLIYREFSNAFRNPEKSPDEFVRVLTTHPSYQERLDVFREAVSELDTEGGDKVGTEPYIEATAEISSRVAEAWRQSMQDKLLRLLLSDPNATKRFGKDYYFLVAELFRLSGKPEELERIPAILRSAQKVAPDDPRVELAMARERLRADDSAGVMRHLERYLEIADHNDHFLPIVKNLVNPKSDTFQYETESDREDSEFFRNPNRRSAYQFHLNNRWVTDGLYNAEGLRATVDGYGLNYLRVQVKPIEDEYKIHYREMPTSITPLDLGELVRAGVVSGNDGIEIVDSKVIDIGGEEGFELTYEYLNDKGLRYRAKYAGVFHNKNYYEVSYRAPTLEYYDKEFEGYRQVINSFRFE